MKELRQTDFTFNCPFCGFRNTFLKGNVCSICCKCGKIIGKSKNDKHLEKKNKKKKSKGFKDFKKVLAFRKEKDEKNINKKERRNRYEFL